MLYILLKCDENDIYWSGYTSKPNKSDFTEWYHKQLQRADRKIWLVKKVNDDDYIGYLYLTCENNFQSTDEIAISHGVKQKYNGQGIGSAIVEFATNKAKSLNTHAAIVAWILENNSPSIRTFVKNGFSKDKSDKYMFFESMKKEVKLIKYILKND